MGRRALPWTELLLSGVLAASGSGTPALAATIPGHGGVQARAFNRVSGQRPAAHDRTYATRPRDAASLAFGKRRAAASSAAAAPGASGRSGDTSVFDGVNADGLYSIDNTAYNQSTPPDTTGGVGPHHYVEFVNSKVAVFKRSSVGFPKATADLDTFVGAFGDATFDPQIQYDPVSGHWFYLVDDIAADGSAFLAFGWSKTSNPTNLAGGWCRFGVPSDLNYDGLAPPGSFFDDYPKLGHDDRRVVFGTNVFQNSPSGDFLTARLWAYPKPADYSRCRPPSVSFVGNPQTAPTPTDPLRTADGDPLGTPEPANTTGPSTKTYVVAADDAEAGPQHQIAVVSAAGPAAATVFRSLGNVGVAPYDVPDSVPQPSSAFRLDSLDARLTQAVAHADPDAGGRLAVWTQHTIGGPGGRSAVRWYEIFPAQCKGVLDCQGAALRQQGTLTDPSQYLFNAAISPALAGNRAVIQYNAGSAADAVSVRAQSRTAAAPLSAMADEITLVASAPGNIDDDFSCDSPPGAACRWGDYSGAAPDPVSHKVVWGANQYNGPAPFSAGDARWRTRVFAISAP